MHYVSSFASLLLAAPFVLATGCLSLFEPDDGPRCDSTIHIGSSIEGDKEVLKASIQCTGDNDCSDSRNVHLDAQVEFEIGIFGSKAQRQISVESEPEGFLEFDDLSNLQCNDEERELRGSIKFANEGAGALVVYADGKEIDRFTVKVQAPERLELKRIDGALDLTSGLVLEQDVSLEIVVRSSTGDRLVAGPEVEWTIEDPDLVEVSPGLFGNWIDLSPLASGSTSLTITVGHLEETFPVEVRSSLGVGGSPSE